MRIAVERLVHPLFGRQLRSLAQLVVAIAAPFREECSVHVEIRRNPLASSHKSSLEALRRYPAVVWREL